MNTGLMQFDSFDDQQESSSDLWTKFVAFKVNGVFMRPIHRYEYIIISTYRYLQTTVL